jgi:arylsulfatase A-like enzyme
MYDPGKMEIPKNPGSDPDGWPLPGTLERLDRGPEWYGMLHGRAPRTVEEWREGIAAHYAVTSYSDALVGYVLDALEASGRAQNTIVVVWSDHGFMLGEHYKWRKGMLRDESTKCVCLIRAPGVAVAGSVCDSPAQTEDFLPTLCELCGIPAPADRHGVSMVPLLAEPGRTLRKGVVSYRGRGDRGLVTGRWRYNRYVGHPEWTELFDRQADPREFTNTVGDSVHAEVVAGLQATLAGGWRALLPAT